MTYYDIHRSPIDSELAIMSTMSPDQIRFRIEVVYHVLGIQLSFDDIFEFIRKRDITSE